MTNRYRAPIIGPFPEYIIDNITTASFKNKVFSTFAEQTKMFDPIKKIMCEDIFKYYVACSNTKKWKTDYENMRPVGPEIPANFVQTKRIELAWRDIYRFIAFLDTECIIPYANSKKDLLNTGYKISIKELWSNRNSPEANHLRNMQVSKLLKNLLETYIFFITLIPPEYQTCELDKNWYILVDKRMQHMEMPIVTKEEIIDATDMEEVALGHHNNSAITDAVRNRSTIFPESETIN